MLSKAQRLRGARDELEVFNLRGSKDDALEEALKQARDALALYEDADGKATPQVRAHVKVAHDVCQAQLDRFGGDTQASVLVTLSEVRKTLDLLWTFMDVAARMGTMGRSTATGPGRLGGRNRGPYGPTKTRRSKS